MFNHSNCPSVQKLEQEGRFLGYSLPGWYVCLRWKRNNYLIIDGIAKSNGKYYKYAEPYLRRIGELVNGGKPDTGEIT
jgi:hypothetical protein